MTSRIREERLRRGVGVRELARRVGVTPGAVSQWERSEERGAIKRETLARALAGIDPELAVDQPAPRRVQPAPFPRPEQRRSYELHRDIARKLIDTPDEVLAVVPGNVERMREHVHGPMAHAWLDEWLTLSRGQLGDLLNVMLATGQHGIDMRQVTPFAGILTHEERLAAIERARAA
jgi:transcriptional regulator with XRE-family HTH domain